MTKQLSARERFYQAARDAGSDPVSEENAILSIGRALLPSCAVIVLNGGEATDEYWDFLRAQTEQAQAEHDAEYATGHEWHE